VGKDQKEADELGAAEDVGVCARPSIARPMTRAAIPEAISERKSRFVGTSVWIRSIWTDKRRRLQRRRLGLRGGLRLRLRLRGGLRLGVGRRIGRRIGGRRLGLGRRIGLGLRPVGSVRTVGSVQTVR